MAVQALSQLASHLQEALKYNELVEVPEQQYAPFRKRLEPASAKALRPLIDLFKGKGQDHIYRLAPKTIANLICIITHAAESNQKQLLLHIFLDGITTYAKSDSLLEILKRYQSDINRERVERLQISLVLGVLHCLVGRINNLDTGTETRWSCVQMLSTVLRTSLAAHQRLRENFDCKTFGRLVERSNDVVLKLLLADVLRELLYHGAEIGQLFSPLTPRGAEAVFPIAAYSTDIWLFNIHMFFKVIGTRTVSTTHGQSIFIIDRLDRFRNSATTEPERIADNAIMTITKELQQINYIHTTASHVLQVTSSPICGRDNMEFSWQSGWLSIVYHGDNGYELSKGHKTTLSSLKCSVEGGIGAFKMEMAEARKISSAEQSKPPVSMALVDLSGGEVILPQTNFRSRSLSPQKRMTEYDVRRAMMDASHIGEALSPMRSPPRSGFVATTAPSREPSPGVRSPPRAEFTASTASSRAKDGRPGSARVDFPGDVAKPVRVNPRLPAAVRDRHKPLLDTVLKVSTNMLQKLGDEEDAITAKSHQFDSGITKAANEMTTSWTERLAHEISSIERDLAEVAGGLDSAKEKCGRSVSSSGEKDSEAGALASLPRQLAKKHEDVNAALAGFVVQESPE